MISTRPAPVKPSEPASPPEPVDFPPLTRFAIPERFAKKRLTILRAMGRIRHRYRWYRAATMTVSLLVLFLVPTLGIARFDLFGDGHRALMDAATPLYGFISVSVAIFSFYLFTFQINLVAGRMFCGWGCPVGQLNRLTDTVRAQRKFRPKLYRAAVLVGFATLLSGSVWLWWSTPSAFVDPRYAPLAWGGLALLIGAAVAFARVFGWSFCRKACPIGLYYSVVQQKRPIGIQFERANCQDEGACVRACPVELDPRNLVQLKSNIGGLALDGLTEHSHCLRCGACVEACGIVTEKIGPIALRFGRPDPVEPTPEPAPLPAQLDASDLVPEAPAAAAIDPLPVVTAPVESDPSPARSPTRTIAFAGLAVALAVAVLLAALSPTRAPDEPAVEAPVAAAEPASVGYTAASGAYASVTLEGRVTRAGAPVVAAGVHLVDPPSGAALGKGQVVDVRIASRSYGDPRYLMSTRDRVAVRNDDGILHTFKVSSALRTVSNLPVPAGRTSPPVRLSNPGTYELGCAIHDDERAQLIVVDHPYFARTDDDGRFSWAANPVGTVKLRVLTENGSVVDREVDVGPETAELEIKLD